MGLICMCGASTCWTERRFWTSNRIFPAFLTKNCGADGWRKRKRDAVGRMRSESVFGLASVAAVISSAIGGLALLLRGVEV